MLNLRDAGVYVTHVELELPVLREEPRYMYRTVVFPVACYLTSGVRFLWENPKTDL